MLIMMIAALLGAPVESRVAPDRSWRPTTKPIVGERQGTGRMPVENLPHANGRSFGTLDAYIAYLREYAAPMDRSWYREVSKDVFRKETGNLRSGEEPQLFTREQLERRFGFRR